MNDITTPTESDIAYMRLALEDAERALCTQDVPVGAVIVGADGAVLARASNRREADQDPTAHAEIVAMRQACAQLGTWRLSGATLYVTLEPCAMCAGALVAARVSRLVYGCHDPKAGAVTSLYALGADPRLNHRFATTSGVLAESAAHLLRSFFATLRAAGEK